MNETIEGLRCIFNKLESDIDSCSFNELILKFDEYYSSLVYGYGKEGLINLGESETGILYSNYLGFGSYLIWLKSYYSRSNKLVEVVGDCHVMLHRILKENGVNTDGDFN